MSVPRHPNAEARNAEGVQKKPRKQRPLVAPPPAYGNKIVLQQQSLSRTARSSESLRCHL